MQASPQKITRQGRRGNAGRCGTLRGNAGSAAHGAAMIVGATLVVAPSEKHCGALRDIAGTHEVPLRSWHDHCATMRGNGDVAGIVGYCAAHGRQRHPRLQ